MNKISEKEIDIVTLYYEILTPALNEMKCKGPEYLCIWKEHVRSAIIRTIIENCYPYVLKEREEKYGFSDAGSKVLVICPEEELHEIGPRMAADFFTLCGFDVTFVGANTPKRSFLSAVEVVKPGYVAVSVTNFYNLMSAKKIIEEIRNRKIEKLKIIAGGNAFLRNPEAVKDVGADLHVQTFQEIIKLSKKQGGD